MYVWHFPIIFLAWLVVTFALAAIFLMVVHLRTSISSPALRGSLVAAGAVAALISPFVMNLWVEREHKFLAALGIFKDYAPWLFFLPLASAVALLLSALALFRTGKVNDAGRWRLYYLTFCFAFASLNIVNWCSPGWCARFGFPLPYSWWSDAIIIMNGRNLTGGNSVIAASLDFAVLVAVALLFAKDARRRTAQSLSE